MQDPGAVFAVMVWVLNWVHHCQAWSLFLSRGSPAVLPPRHVL